MMDNWLSSTLNSLNLSDMYEEKIHKTSSEYEKEYFETFDHLGELLKIIVWRCSQKKRVLDCNLLRKVLTQKIGRPIDGNKMKIVFFPEEYDAENIKEPVEEQNGKLELPAGDKGIIGLKSAVYHDDLVTSLRQSVGLPAEITEERFIELFNQAVSESTGLYRVIDCDKVRDMIRQELEIVVEGENDIFLSCTHAVGTGQTSSIDEIKLTVEEKAKVLYDMLNPGRIRVHMPKHTTISQAVYQGAVYFAVINKRNYLAEAQQSGDLQRVFELLAKDGRWDLVEQISRLAEAASGLCDDAKTMARIYYWYACKRQGRFAEVEGEAKAADYSEKSPLFTLLKCALLNNFDGFFTLMDPLIDDGIITVRQLAAYTIFDEMRRELPFRFNSGDVLA